jgi:predicted nucleic acid-binding protein
MPGRVAFLDTNGWLALLNASDSLHAEADALWKDLGETPLLHRRHRLDHRRDG